MLWTLFFVCICTSFIAVKGEIEEGCSVPYPTFCTNVNWAVSDQVIENMITTSADLQVNIMFVNFEGTKSCKQRYRDLHCSYLYPKCTSKSTSLRPCRSDCESFTDDCPGALLSCESFPESVSECYSMQDDDSSSSTMNHIPLLLFASFSVVSTLLLVLV